MNNEINNILGQVNATEQQAFEKIIELSKTLNKEELLELFTATIYSFSTKNSQIINAIANSNNNLNLVTNYAEATSKSIKNIDKTADEILYKRNPIDTPVSENALPGDILK